MAKMVNPQMFPDDTLRKLVAIYSTDSSLTQVIFIASILNSAQAVNDPEIALNLAEKLILAAEWRGDALRAEQGMREKVFRDTHPRTQLHIFKGRHDRDCDICGLPDRADVHKC